MAKITQLPPVAALTGNEMLPMLQGNQMVRASPAQVAELMDADSRPRTLADAERNHILFPKNAKYFNGGVNQVGAIKVRLPEGIDARETTQRVIVHDHYGSLVFHIGGRNDGGWNYQTVRLEGQHRILAEHPVRFGHDGLSTCVWIGDPTYAYWDNLTVMVLEATFTGQVITEAWMGAWFVGLTTTIENVYAGPIATHLPVTTQHIKIDPARLGMAIGIGAGVSPRASNYTFFAGPYSGATVGPDDFNLVGVGLQTFSETNGSSASTAVGIQALQHAKKVINTSAYGIHATLSLEYGDSVNAYGAGAMEYGTNLKFSNAFAAYAGRDNQADYCLFLGNHAGMYSVNEAGAFHVAKDENESLLRGNFFSRYLNVNGQLASEGLNPLADNTYALGSGTLRFSAIYVASGQISTSDERQKTEIEAIPQAWLDAWGEVEWSRYKFKGGTRWHTGLVAQRVHAAFARHGIDAFEIGLMCYDEWDEETVPATEDTTVVKKWMEPVLKDEPIQLVEIGRTEDDQPILGIAKPADPEMVERSKEIVQRVETEGTVTVRAAGNMYGLRYDECFAVEAAWQRQQITLQRERSYALEARLAALEKAA